MPRVYPPEEWIPHPVNDVAVWGDADVPQSKVDRAIADLYGDEPVELSEFEAARAKQLAEDDTH